MGTNNVVAVCLPVDDPDMEPRISINGVDYQIVAFGKEGGPVRKHTVHVEADEWNHVTPMTAAFHSACMGLVMATKNVLDSYLNEGNQE